MSFCRVSWHPKCFTVSRDATSKYLVRVFLFHKKYLDGVVKAEKVVIDSCSKSGLDLVNPCSVASIIGPSFELVSRPSRFSRLDEADFIDFKLFRLPVLLPPKWNPHFRRTPRGFDLGVFGETSEGSGWLKSCMIKILIDILVSRFKGCQRLE